MAYYIQTSQLEEIPRLVEQGPDVLDEYPSLEDFKSGLRRFQGEIKGILTRGRFLAGIGNAYADEALFEAGVFPFKKRKALSEDDLSRPARFHPQSSAQRHQRASGAYERGHPREGA